MRTAAATAGALLLAQLIARCGGVSHPPPPVDGGPPPRLDGGADAGVSEDGGVPGEDGGAVPDGGAEDASTPDAGEPDAAVPDAGPLDAGAEGDGGLPADGGLTGCSQCHGSADSPAPPRDTQGHTDTALRTVGAHRTHLKASPWHRTGECADCHVVPASVGDPGHLDPAPAEIAWGEVAGRGGASPSWDGQRCSVYCHGQTLMGGAQTTPRWTRVAAGEANCGSCHGVPPPAPHPTVQTAECGGCHPFQGLDPRDPARHVDGVLDVTAPCGSCHEIPPRTGSHLAHAAYAARDYGSLGTAADLPTPEGYAFGCGHCHPLDPRRHRAGPAAVELFDPLAPSGSLKAKNPPTARYEAGRCSDVYCHSGMRTWTSDVPYPALDTSDGGYRLVYDPPYTVERVREYRAVTWGGARLGCGGCHGYPPTGVHPDAKACAGESHACVDEGGYGNLHAFNHGYDPIPCRSCHARTVTEVAAFTRDSLDVTTFADIPVSGLARHADGEIDVAFDAVNPVVYPRSSLPPISMDLGAARWNAETRTCTGVPCHLQQSEVAFGAPYRWESTSECNVCHRY